MAKEHASCFICDKELKCSDKNSKFTPCPNSENTIRNILSHATKRSTAGDHHFASFCNKEQSSCAGFHWNCYRSLVNKTNLLRLEDTYLKSDNARPKRRRPSASSLVKADAGPSRTKRKSTLYDKNKCVFCQSDHESHQLHNVKTASMGGRIIRILENSNNPIPLLK